MLENCDTKLMFYAIRRERMLIYWPGTARGGSEAKSYCSTVMFLVETEEH